MMDNIATEACSVVGDGDREVRKHYEAEVDHAEVNYSLRHAQLGGDLCSAWSKRRHIVRRISNMWSALK